MSRHFKMVFLTRFLGYLVLQVGLIALILMIEPVVAEEFKYRTNQLLGRRYRMSKSI